MGYQQTRKKTVSGDIFHPTTMILHREVVGAFFYHSHVGKLSLFQPEINLDSAGDIFIEQNQPTCGCLGGSATDGRTTGLRLVLSGDSRLSYKLHIPPVPASALAGVFSLVLSGDSA